jgi:hypothetical protein
MQSTNARLTGGQPNFKYQIAVLEDVVDDILQTFLKSTLPTAGSHVFG